MLDPVTEHPEDPECHVTTVDDEVYLDMDLDAGAGSFFHVYISHREGEGGEGEKPEPTSLAQMVAQDVAHRMRLH